MVHRLQYVVAPLGGLPIVQCVFLKWHNSMAGGWHPERRRGHAGPRPRLGCHRRASQGPTDPWIQVTTDRACIPCCMARWRDAA